MSKIICDICGTSYQDTAECCPICGCSKDGAAEFLSAETTIDEIPAEMAEAKPSRLAPKRNKEIFDFDAVNDERKKKMPRTTATTTMPKAAPKANTLFEDEQDDTENEESGKTNIVVVIVLTIVIALLLCAAGFMLVRYFLPKKEDKQEVNQKPAQEQVVETPTEEVEGIPCQMLILTSGTAELSKEGQMFLLHVQPTPEDTTDVITYSSADESVATVTKDGKVTAVAEGETVINITCGNIQTTCPVVVRYVEETKAVEETEAAPNEGENGEEENTPVETTKPASNGANKNVTLKLKKTDIRLGVYYSYQLQLDCDLEQDEVQWRSEHPYIATVSEDGTVKAIKDGTTSIIATYGDQEVSCIVRCVFAK